MINRLPMWARHLLTGVPKQTSSYRLTREEAEKRRSGGIIEDIFFSEECRPINKWIDYFPVYERFFHAYRGKDIVMIEIGVFQGGSLDMWRRYFGEDARIFGIDVDPDCAKHADASIHVRIGSQDDPVFLESVIAEAGRPHIVLDDGSHVGKHQTASFRCLWPHLRTGGIYVIEDVHTSYWRRFGGGYKKRGTAIELAKTLIDDMHDFFHFKGPRYAPADEIRAVHIYDSIIVIEKCERPAPGHIMLPARL